MKSDRVLTVDDGRCGRPFHEDAPARFRVERMMPLWMSGLKGKAPCGFSPIPAQQMTCAEGCTGFRRFFLDRRGKTMVHVTGYII